MAIRCAGGMTRSSQESRSGEEAAALGRCVSEQTGLPDEGQSLSTGVKQTRPWRTRAPSQETRRPKSQDLWDTWAKQ